MIVVSFSEQSNPKNKIHLLFVQTYQKRKDVPYMKMPLDKERRKRESPYIEMSGDNDQKDAFINNEMQLQSLFLDFHWQKEDTSLS